MEVNKDLLKPFVKLRVCDLTRNTLKNLANSIPFQMVWLQSNVKKIVSSDIIEIVEADDPSNYIAITGCLNIPGGLPSALKNGEYCQVLGEIYEDASKKVAIRAVKVVHIQDKVLQEMWAFEVEELKTI